MYNICQIDQLYICEYRKILSDPSFKYQNNYLHKFVNFAVPKPYFYLTKNLQ